MASELRFFSGGGAWAVLAALVVSVASFTTLLAWPVLGGGALLPLRTTVSGLWNDAAWGLRGLGVDVVGPADPFAGVLAVLGSMWPGSPSFVLVLLWILALAWPRLTTAERLMRVAVVGLMVAVLVTQVSPRG